MQTAKIIPIPTRLMWWHLQAQHKRIVHKPTSEHQKRNQQQVQMLEAAIGKFQPNTGEVA